MRVSDNLPVNWVTWRARTEARRTRVRAGRRHSGRQQRSVQRPCRSAQMPAPQRTACPRPRHRGLVAAPPAPLGAAGAPLLLQQPSETARPYAVIEPQRTHADPLFVPCACPLPHPWPGCADRGARCLCPHLQWAVLTRQYHYPGATCCYAAALCSFRAGVQRLGFCAVA